MHTLRTVLGIAAALSLATPAFAQRGRMRRDRPREGKLKVGDPAPDFTLRRLKGKDKVKLSSFKGKRPVVLIFGSYT